jgi:hypothetical protein
MSNIIFLVVETCYKGSRTSVPDSISQIRNIRVYKMSEVLATRLLPWLLKWIIQVSCNSVHIHQWNEYLKWDYSLTGRPWCAGEGSSWYYFFFLFFCIHFFKRSSENEEHMGPEGRDEKKLVQPLLCSAASTRYPFIHLCNFSNRPAPAASDTTITMQGYSIVPAAVAEKEPTAFGWCRRLDIKGVYTLQYMRAKMQKKKKNKKIIP